LVCARLPSPDKSSLVTLCLFNRAGFKLEYIDDQTPLLISISPFNLYAAGGDIVTCALAVDPTLSPTFDDIAADVKITVVAGFTQTSIQVRQDQDVHLAKWRITAKFIVLLS
jgi:hypothetical protein